MNLESCVYFLSEQPEGGMPEKQFAKAGQGEKVAEEQFDSTIQYRRDA